MQIVRLTSAGSRTFFPLVPRSKNAAAAGVMHKGETMELNFQYAHHSHDEFETQSNVSSGEALIAFDKFDWEGEVEKANELQKCSPTLSVLINGTEEMVWVSVCGGKSNIQFVSECYFPGEVSKWFGLSKVQGTVNLSNQSLSKVQARMAIDLLVVKNYAGLRELYA